MFRTLYVICGALCIINPVSGETDPQCFDSCACCINEACGSGLFGWTNVCTIGCIDGHRGARCYELCQYENCKSCGGSSLTNICTECYDGYYLGPNKDCTSKCPSNCKSCTSSTNCTECKEGFINKNGSTTCPYVHCPTNCECEDGQGSCNSCKKGFYDTATSCLKQCPENCLACESDKLCNECKNGFYNGFEYDISINHPSNNCSYTCRDNCTQCRSYDNCLRCREGKYGNKCQEDCSVGCKGKTCLVDSGQCDCTIYFKGDKCVECVDGRYGLYCNQTCSKYCKGNICERNTGVCISGCINEELTGDTCNSCKVGMFDELCDKTCSFNCQQNECERYSGNCSRGCKEYFNGTLCDLCVHGNYGEYCKSKCSVNCAGGICKRETGFCYQCIGNYRGETCDKCLSGYYGQHCEEKCSRQCQNKTCTKDTGVCVDGCENGYSGDKCCVEGENCLNCFSNTMCRQCKSGFFKHSCKERCPNDCADSCEMSTGACNTCRFQRFGVFCNFDCSVNCKNLNENVSRCAQSDGTCLFGCEDGYYGATCNKACSSLCVENVCRQETGVCTKGCIDKEDKPECVSVQETAEGGNGVNTTIAAVLGSMLAVSLLIIIVLAIVIIVIRRKMSSRRMPKRKQFSVTYENKLASPGEEHDYQQINSIATTISQQ